MRIVKYKNFLNDYKSLKFTLESKKSDGGENEYSGVITYKRKKFKGQIYTDNVNELECFQFYDKDGVDILEYCNESVFSEFINNEIKKIS